MTLMELTSDRPTTTVVICALDEEENLFHVLPAIPDWVDEVLLVDGHSTDRTVEVAREIRPDIVILHQSGAGKDNALRQGILHAKGAIVITVDADGNSDPGEIPNFVRPLLAGYEFAKGSRFLGIRPRMMPWYRRIGNQLLVAEANLLFGTRYTDLCSGFNACWKSAWERIQLPEGFGYEPVIILRARKAGLRMIEVPSLDKGRISGSTKLPFWRQGWGAFKAIALERFRG